MREGIRPTRSLIMPNAVWMASDLTSTEKMILSEIIFLQDYGEAHKNKVCCWADNFYFMGVFGISKRQASQSISNLAQKGYIEARYSNHNERILVYNYEKCFATEIKLGKPKN